MKKVKHVTIASIPFNSQLEKEFQDWLLSEIEQWPDILCRFFNTHQPETPETRSTDSPKNSTHIHIIANHFVRIIRRGETGFNFLTNGGLEELKEKRRGFHAAKKLGL